MVSLNRLIRMTIAYYDVFKLPLTSFEIWKYLTVPDGESMNGSKTYRLSDVVFALDEELAAKRIGMHRGMYVLPGRECLVSERIREDKVSTARLKRVRKLVFVLRYIPFIRMVGVTGSLSIKQSGQESDWDLFLVLRSGYIFTGRTVVTAFLHLIRKRRYGHHIRNRACLNYFVTGDGLEIGTKDLFSAHEYRFLIPFFGFDMFRRFERANIVWLRRFKPNAALTEVAPLWMVADTVSAARLRRGMESMLSLRWIEAWLSRWQREKIARNPKTHRPGALIEASDAALVFLPKPRGPRVFEVFKKRLSEYMIF